MTRNQSGIFVSGIYAADLVFSGRRLPAPGETVTADGFMRSHGGKGSNQAIAAVRAGAQVRFFTLIGDDAFGRAATALWQAEGICSMAKVIDEEVTGAAGIFLDTRTGHNSIFVYPGASRLMTPAHMDALEAEIAASAIFVIQLEQPAEVAARGLEIAHENGVTTILNPAPATILPDDIFARCDYLIPNETEASLLSGIAVNSLESAKAAADVLLEKGVRNVIITLGEKGAVLCNADESHLSPAVYVGPCIDTTGAGDGFAGGFAAGLARGLSPKQAMQFASALAGISVTRHGAAVSMPGIAEIEQVLKNATK
ncbi:ribokinase [Allopusillimonas ginsengisoli]|uniref:ribokinase n=1 Tax=Allopusillimonas ginsengisoli TaxID=453575 RepID=UPI0039C175CE